MRVLITGGAGFIGSNFVHTFSSQFEKVVVVDKLTYAGRRENLEPLLSEKKIEFVQQDITSRETILQLLRQHAMTCVVHFAAESHVDNSIMGPSAFIQSNVFGTFSLLEAARAYLSEKSVPDFRLLHVSTDEVFGSLGSEGRFNEGTPYAPNSPYSASKAASDHLVRAWGHTYGIPVLVTNCSNNYGPRQHSEKLIPTVIRKALGEENIPVYGNGKNVRDWIHVDDHNDGVFSALTKGRIGESYCFGGDNEITNLDLVGMICDELMKVRKPKAVKHYRDLISFVTDRAGHDFRYAIDFTKAKKELGFSPRKSSFHIGLTPTIQAYLED